MTKAFKLGLFLFTFLLFACANEEPIDFQVIYQSEFELHDILIDEDGWIASGGETFTYGMVLQYDNEAGVVVHDSLFDKSILCVDTLKGVIASGGIYSICNDENTFWRCLQSPELYFLNDILLEQDRMITVGGAGLSTGIVYEWNRDLSLKSQHTFEQELSCILHVEGVYMVGGYGFLQKSEDLISWNSILDKDDHYIDLEHGADGNIYALGASGRVLRSSDLGGEWDQIKSPAISGISAAKDLHLANDMIYLADGNKIYKTPVDAVEWLKHEFEGVGEINKISSAGNSITFVTTAGEVVQFID